MRSSLSPFPPFPSLQVPARGHLNHSPSPPLVSRLPYPHHPPFPCHLPYLLLYLTQDSAPTRGVVKSPSLTCFSIWICISPLTCPPPPLPFLCHPPHLFLYLTPYSAPARGHVDFASARTIPIVLAPPSPFPKHLFIPNLTGSITFHLPSPFPLNPHPLLPQVPHLLFSLTPNSAPTKGSCRFCLSNNHPARPRPLNNNRPFPIP